MNGTNILLLVSFAAVVGFWIGFLVKWGLNGHSLLHAIPFALGAVLHVLFSTVAGLLIFQAIKLNLPLQ